MKILTFLRKLFTKKSPCSEYMLRHNLIKNFTTEYKPNRPIDAHQPNFDDYFIVDGKRYYRTHIEGTSFGKRSFEVDNNK